MVKLLDYFLAIPSLNLLINFIISLLLIPIGHLISKYYRRFSSSRYKRSLLKRIVFVSKCTHAIRNRSSAAFISPYLCLTILSAIFTSTAIILDRIFRISGLLGEPSELRSASESATFIMTIFLMLMCLHAAWNFIATVQMLLYPYRKIEALRREITKAKTDILPAETAAQMLELLSTLENNLPKDKAFEEERGLYEIISAERR